MELMPGVLSVTDHNRLAAQFSIVGSMLIKPACVGEVLDLITEES